MRKIPGDGLSIRQSLDPVLLQNHFGERIGKIAGRIGTVGDRVVLFGFICMFMNTENQTKPMRILLEYHVS